MALQGNLEDFELTDVIQLIQLGQKDGGLQIQIDEDIGVMYFKNGMVIHAKTNFLRGEPAIDSILSWKKGRFVFNPGEEAVENTVDLPIQQVVLEAARRIDELGKIQKLIPSFDIIVTIVEVPAVGVNNINLMPEEWKVLSFVDGSRTIKEIAQKINISEFKVSKILYGMISSSLVQIVQRAEPEKPEQKKDETKEKKKEGRGFFGLFRKK
ncbi:DUF4388 domain-containing protein [candidate division WOR-3 bacterium]|nr:DUF4388 domain-containing protein [candidate division WOR-3 bacterium]